MTERLWFKIGETATRLGVSPKELRYWESVIPELKPRRSKGNLRYYHVDEFPRLERIRQWLAEGFTVADCRELMLHGQLTRQLGLFESESEEPPPPPPSAKGAKAVKPRPTGDLKGVEQALKKLIARLERPVGGVRRRKPSLDQPLDFT